jgi:hypothetical protein
MSQCQGGNATHNAAVSVAEGIRGVTVAAATTQAQATAAEITFYRACLASGLANNVGIGPYLAALRQLGVNQ